jgi:PKD repeat protein
VRVTEARLLDLPYAPGDQVQASLTVASTDPVTVAVQAWLLYPDGARSAESADTVSLQAVLNNHVSLTLPLSATHPSTSLRAWAGPHRLVYVITDPNDPARVYAAGSEAFDVGAVVILGARTDRESYPYATDPVTVTLTIFAAAPTSANLDLLVDDIPIANITLVLTAGVQAIAVPLPGPIAPAWHDLTARVEVNGLSHAASTSFAYGTDVVDLAVGTPQIVGVSGTTRTLRVRVTNIGGTDADATTIQFWDGTPGDGGTLIGTQPLAPLAAGESAQVELAWDVMGQGGPHTITVVADPNGALPEFHEHNNVAAAEVIIPPFELAVEADAIAYDEGGPVLVTVWLTNLAPDPATLVVTTTIESASHGIVFTDVHALHASAASYANRAIVWDTDWTANDTYTIRAEGEGGLNGGVVVVSVNNVPPTVDAGPDQSAEQGAAVQFGGFFTDPGLADTHTIEWDFGDGATASATLSPTHAYTATGTYTVTLTVTDGDGGVGSDTLVVTVSEGAVQNPICDNLARSVTYVDSGYAPTCTDVSPEPGRLKLVDSHCNPITGVRINLRTASGGYITYRNTDTNGVANFSDYGGPATPGRFEVDYHGAKHMTEAGSYDTGAVVQTQEYRLQFVGSDCTPIQGARVNLRKADDAYVTYVTTDADLPAQAGGVASFQVVPGAQMKLEVDYHGAKWLSEANTADVDVILGAEAFRLRLVDSGGNPIGNARVNLRKADGAYVTYTTTDDEGIASFEVVPGGALKLEVDYHGATYATPVTTVSDDTQLEVQTQRLAMKVTDSMGQPIADARVNLRKADGAYVTYTETGGDGIAFFEVLPGAEMRLELDYHGATHMTDPVTVNGYVEIPVQTKAFSLRLTDSTGQPIAGARVNLRKADGAYVTYTTTDDDLPAQAGGIASFEVVPGAQMKLEVDYHGGQYATQVTTVDADTQLELQTVLLTVHVTANGTDLAGQRVDLLKADGSYVTYAETGAGGRVTFEILPGVQHKVRCTYDGVTWVSDGVTGPTEVAHEF